MRPPVCLDIIVEMLRNQHEGSNPSRLHRPPGRMDVVKINNFAELRGIQLLRKIPRGGAAVFIHDADRQVIRKSVPEECQVKYRVDDDHAHRGQQVQRPLADDADFPLHHLPDIPYEGFPVHYFRFKITLIPGSRPSTGLSGRARTSKVRVSYSPISLVAFQVA